ncbi:MAG TPA: hypothetical protein ENG13_02460 [bacterium]|nr:hypothetical protein [bacterium]HEX67909.1 hypothetical protein [bacterium]
MLREEYSKYILPDERGNFPEFTQEWVFLKKGREKVKAEGKGVPSLTFRGSAPWVIIKNSPLFWSGRVLEFVMENDKSRREKVDFSGEIILQ